MAPDRGVFPGQWGLPGGGVEPGGCLELNSELSEAAWVPLSDLTRCELNSANVETFRSLGWMQFRRGSTPKSMAPE